MPANLTAEAKGKWEKASATKDPEEKLKALQEFLSAIPKHKGNERLRDQIKRKIAALRSELETRKRKKAGASTPFLVDKEGAAQLVIIGPTNVGKSSLLSALTNAKPEIASHPYTTSTPVPGMMRYEDLRFQLIELPALVEGALKPQVVEMTRHADAFIIMLDLTRNAAGDLRQILASLENAGISYAPSHPQIEIERTRGLGEPAIFISGKLLDCTVTDVRRTLVDFGFKNVTLRIQGDVKLKEIEDAVLETERTYKPGLLLANKCDLKPSPETFAALAETIGDAVPLLRISALTGEGLDQLGSRLLQILKIIRVYTKEPNQERPSGEPFILKAGATVADLARAIHSFLLTNYKYARIWGPSSKFPGERVGSSHTLSDLDVVEIHTR